MGTDGTIPLVMGGMAFLLSFILTPVVSRVAERRRIFSDPQKIRFYLHRRPLLGHTVLFVVFFMTLGVSFALRLYSDEYYYLLAQMKRMSVGLFLASLFLTISATYSDVRNEPDDLEWLYIIVGALMLYAFGIRFTILRIPFLGTIDLHSWGALLLIIWVLLLVSIVELLDFFEGLAGALVAVVSGIYLILHTLAGKEEMFIILFFALFGGSVLGILPYQVFQKKILYGKSGNKILGFLFAAGTVIAHRKETTSQFVLFPIAILLFIIVVINFLFLDHQLRPLSASGQKKGRS